MGMEIGKDKVRQVEVIQLKSKHYNIYIGFQMLLWWGFWWNWSCQVITRKYIKYIYIWIVLSNVVLLAQHSVSDVRRSPWKAEALWPWPDDPVKVNTSVIGLTSWILTPYIEPQQTLNLEIFGIL